MRYKNEQQVDSLEPQTPNVELERLKTETIKLNAISGLGNRPCDFFVESSSYAAGYYINIKSSNIPSNYG